MANPRDNVKHVDSRYVRKTVKHNGTIVYNNQLPNGSAQVGLACRLVADDTVALTVDASPVYGKVEIVEADGKCVVTTWGHFTLPSGGNAPGTPLAVGAAIVGALGGAGGTNPGYIRAVAPATLADVAAGRGEVINNDVAGAQVIDFTK